MTEGSRKARKTEGTFPMAVSRREIATAGTAAVAAQLLPAQATRAGGTHASMKLGCQSAPTSDAHLKYLARYGVKHICGYPETSEGRIASTVDELSRRGD